MQGGAPASAYLQELACQLTNKLALISKPIFWPNRRMNLEELQATTKGLLPELLGIRFLEATPDLVRAELVVRDDLCTLPGLLHGGAVMAFADTLGAYGTAIAMPHGANTTTIESKTNFFRGGRSGETVVGTATPLHKGRTTMVWTTRIESQEGKLIAQVTQTQLVMLPQPKSD